MSRLAARPHGLLHVWMTRYHIDTFLLGGVRLLIGKLSGACLLALLCCLFQEIRAVSQTLEDQMAHATCQPVVGQKITGAHLGPQAVNTFKNVETQTA